MEKHIKAPISKEVSRKLRAGDYVYITGTIYTARDAAHKRMDDALKNGENLPVGMVGQTIYYMGPSPAREGRPIGSAGPTTAYRENMAKAAAKKLPLFLSSTMLYRRETQYIKQQVAEFGKPVHYIYHIGQYLPDWHPWENYKNFFVGNARTGGVREIFGIDLPWLLDAFGDVESVTVQKDTISDLGLPYPDCVTLLLRHKGGVQGVLAADVVSRKAVRSFECFGDGIHLFWEGNPKALYEFKDGDKRFVNTYASFEHDSRYSDNVVENAYVDELTNFFGVLKGDEQPKWSFEKDLKAIELMDFIESH